MHVFLLSVRAYRQTDCHCVVSYQFVVIAYISAQNTAMVFTLVLWICSDMISWK